MGSSNVLTDRNGERVKHYEYTAFGKERFNDTTCTFTVSNRYTGQIFDDDTGLYYYNSRYYDPELGRFTQPDTIVPDPGNPQDLNRYSYVGNNPLNYTDPTGHDGASGSGSLPAKLPNERGRWHSETLRHLEWSISWGFQIAYWDPASRASFMNWASLGMQLADYLSQASSGYFNVNFTLAGTASVGQGQNPHSGASSGEFTLQGTANLQPGMNFEASTPTSLGTVPTRLAVFIVTEIRPQFFTEVGVKTGQQLVFNTDGTIVSTYTYTGSTYVGSIGFTGVSTFEPPLLTGSFPNFTLTMTAQSRSAPLLFGPYINYSFTLDFNVRTRTGTLWGTHDSFPSYMVRFGGTTIYDFQQQRFLGLLGSGDIRVAERFKW